MIAMIWLASVMNSTDQKALIWKLTFQKSAAAESSFADAEDDA